MNCPNCNCSLNDDTNFCPSCGQSRKDLNRPFRQLIAESFFELLDIDGRLSRTLYALLFKPGHLSSNYRAGQRISSTPPLRLYLITSLLLFFVMSLVKTDYSNDVERISFLLLPSGLLEDIPKIMVILLPIYALVLQLFQPHSKYIFNLVFSVHIHTFWYLVFILFLTLQNLSTYLPELSYLNWLIAVYLLVYQFLAIKHFFNLNWFKSLLVNVFTLAIYIGAFSLSIEIAAEIQKTF